MYLSERFVTASDLNQVEKYADRLFAKVGVDIEFTRHFVDRVNDERNKKQISVAELVRIFNKVYQKFGKAIARLGPDAEAVMKDMITTTDKMDSYFLNFSDGMPMYSNDTMYYQGDDARKHTRDMVNKMRKMGIKVLSYFINDRYR